MSLVGITWKFPKWQRKLESAIDEFNLFLAANMQTNRGMLFDSAGSYNGHEKWASLRLREGMPLSNRGVLRKSMAPYNASGRPGPSGIVRFAGDEITIGTTLAIARLMNDGTVNLPGGVIRPKRAKALKIPVPAGFIKSQKLRVSLLREDLSNESSMRRKASLERRIHNAQKLINEAKTTSSRKKRLDYLFRLEKKMRSTKGRENIEKLSRRKNRVEGDKGQFIFRKSVKIPPRPFDNWTREDQLEFEIAMRNKLVEILNR